MLTCSSYYKLSKQKKIQKYFTLKWYHNTDSNVKKKSNHQADNGTVTHY